MILRRVFYALIPLLVIVAGIEFALRSVGWPQVTAAFEHNEPFWTVDPDLRRKSFPHKEEKTHFSVSTNRDGLRFPLHEIDKPEGIIRLMTLGCSTTFGWGVDNEMSYPAQLEERIHESGFSELEVINAGQPGYTSFQGMWLWDRILRDYVPDIVLVGYVVQDARKASYTDQSQAILQGDHRYLKNHFLYRSKMYLALRSMLGHFQIRAKERKSQDEGGIHRVPTENFAANITKIVKEIQSVGAQPVLFGFPLEREGYTKEHRSVMRATAASLGVKHLDLQSKMEQASREDILYFERDRGHANAKGNTKIAHWVADFLATEKMLGDGWNGL